MTVASTDTAHAPLDREGRKVNKSDASKQVACWNDLLAQAGAFVDSNAIEPHMPEQQFSDIIMLLTTARAIGASGTGECQPARSAKGRECSVCAESLVETYRYCPGCGCLIK